MTDSFHWQPVTEFERRPHSNNSQEPIYTSVEDKIFSQIEYKKTDRTKKNIVKSPEPVKFNVSFQPTTRQIRNAFRNSISDQIDVFKSCYPCPKGLLNAEVDHVGYSFVELVDMFLQQEDLKLEHIKITCWYKPIYCRYMLNDRKLLKAWQEFHMKKASLQWSTRIVNRKKSDNGYRKCKNSQINYNK